MSDSLVAAEWAALQQAAALIEQADALIIAAGAGMGVDSGLPDFRGKGGFWRAYPALREARVDFQDIACPDAFRRTPELAWGFYGHRLSLYRKVAPHAGFAALKRWGERMPNGMSVFTSNVDGQFQKAGFDPESIHECHGSIHHFQCLKPCCRKVWPADGFEPEVDVERCVLRNVPPSCPECGGMARPNVMMFNDWDWVDGRSGRQEARQRHWLCSVSRPVVIEIGAGTAIPSVRYFSQSVVHDHGGKIIRINPHEHEVAPGTGFGLRMAATVGLHALSQMLGNSPQEYA